jgi:hypothetical protein
MELIEKYDIKKLYFLKDMDIDIFKNYNKCKNKNDRINEYKKLQNFINLNIKTNGKTKKIYTYNDEIFNGRLYSSNSIQSLSKEFRGFLIKDNTTDIDIKNTSPTILRYLCHINNIQCPNLSYYVDNREEILKLYPILNKQLFISSINNNKTTKIKNKLFIEFDKECKIIQEKLCNLDE